MRRILAAGAACLMGACAKPAPTPPPGPNVVTITATDYAFGLPDTLPAGLTEFHLVNHGAEVHHAAMVRVTGDHRPEEVAQALEQVPPPDWVAMVPGPNQAAPHDSSNTTVILEPGNYLLICFIPSPDGMPHFMKGMTRAFTVTGTVPADAALPEADVMLTLADYEFRLSTPLTAGTHTIRVENAGPQLHEVGIERLADGKTLADYQAWMAQPQGPPPVRPMGGVIGPAPGAPAATFTITLTPGHYLLTCYVPDAGDRRPHVAHGMVQEIEIM